MTHAFHSQSGNNHVFGVGDLHVLITQDEDGFFAHGVQINYFACGETLEDVKKRFEVGLVATIREHIKRYENLDRFMRWAPSEVRDMLDGEKYSFSMLNHQEIEAEKFPFHRIQYLKEITAEAA